MNQRRIYLTVLCMILILSSWIRTKQRNQTPQKTIVMGCPYSNASNYPPEISCRQYHRCTSVNIPYISQPLETAEHLLFTNDSFVRFGDSELLLIRGGSEPFQSYSVELARRLIQAFKDSDIRIMIGLYDTFSGFPLWNKGFANWWMDNQNAYQQWVLDNADLKRRYYSAMLTSTYVHTFGTQCALVSTIYDILREVWRNKDVIILKGDNKQVFQYDVYDTARSQTVFLAPRYHAWKAYDEIKAKLFHESSDKLFLLTAGPISRVLTYDLAKSGRRALDLGHLAKDYNLFKMQSEPNIGQFFERNERPPRE